MIKKLFYILLLLAFVHSVSFADIKSLMEKGNEYYKNNHYQLAIDEYSKLVSDGYQGASLFYNLGNAYYRLGKVGYAILYYEKAIKLAPGDEDIKHNLQLAKLNLKDKVDALPPFFIFNIWEGLLAAFSVTGWSYVVYIVFIILLLTLLSYFFSRTITQQRLSFFTGVFILFLFFLSIALLAVKMNKEYNIKSIIIVEPSVIVKSEPNNSSKDEFQIHEGLKARLEDKVDDWIKIRLEDGKIGWISEKNARII